MAINPLQQPVNYLAALPQVDLGQQFAAFGQALAQRQERETALNARKQYAADLQSTLDNPTQEAWSTLIAKYPSQREAFKDAREGFGKARLEKEFNQGFKVSMALNNNNPEVAKAEVKTIIDAINNSGGNAGIYQQIYDALDSGNVKGAQADVNMVLSMADPDRFKKMVDAQGAAAAAPSALTEAVAKADRAVSDAKTAQATARNAEEKAAADAALARANAEKAEADALVAKETTGAKISKEKSEAEKAAVAAKFAESNAAMDLEKKGWDIRKLQSDMQIAKQNASIAAANNAIAREGNDLKRGELQLKLRELQDKRDQTVRERVSEANTSAMQADNLLNTVDGLMSKIVEGKDKKGNPIFSSSFRAATGPVDVLFPTIQTDVADIQEQFETLGSQITMSRIGEMKGALSNKDLDTLRQSLQALQLRQSPEQLYKNLQEVQRLTLKARKGAFDKYGIPESRPDTPNVQPSAQEVNDILKKYGG